MKIEGIGEKTAEKLIQRAQEMVVQLEAEYKKRHAAEKAAAAEIAEPKLSEADLFEDSPDYVSEIDDVLVAGAPDLDEIDEEDEGKATKISVDDEEIDE